MVGAEIEPFCFDADPGALDDFERCLKQTIWPDEVIAEPWRSAMRLYSESREHPLHLAAQRITPPCGIVHLPGELPMPPRSWAERAFNIVHWSNLPRGGHFAAWEAPEPLAEDIPRLLPPTARGLPIANQGDTL